jgi:hypothetical protein
LAWLLHLIYMHDVWTNPGSAACTPAKIRCTLAVCSLPARALVFPALQAGRERMGMF